MLCSLELAFLSKNNKNAPRNFLASTDFFGYQYMKVVQKQHNFEQKITLKEIKRNFPIPHSWKTYSKILCSLYQLIIHVWGLYMQVA